MGSRAPLIHSAIEAFCKEFVESPYLCYTEHGLHARFYSQLYGILPAADRYMIVGGEKVCVVQKEYPTAGCLGKPQRQHWDVALLQSPPLAPAGVSEPYDFLRLESVVEFGLNETLDHLIDDVKRLTHPDANLEMPFAVHLYRVSDRFSARDISPRSAKLLGTRDLVQALWATVQGTNVELYCAFAGRKSPHYGEVWRLTTGGCTKL